MRICPYFGFHRHYTPPHYNLSSRIAINYKKIKHFHIRLTVENSLSFAHALDGKARLRYDCGEFLVA